MHVLEAAVDGLVATDYADACPMATVALDVASSNEVLRVATAQVFDERVGAGAQGFGRWVADQQAARSLAASEGRRPVSRLTGRSRTGAA